MTKSVEILNLLKKSLMENFIFCAVTLIYFQSLITGNLFVHLVL